MLGRPRSRRISVPGGGGGGRPEGWGLAPFRPGSKRGAVPASGQKNVQPREPTGPPTFGVRVGEPPSLATSTHPP